MTTKVLIDCDPSADDAIALMLAFASPELEIAGVVATAGVTTAQGAADNVCKIARLCGRDDIRVAVGAAQPLVRSLVFDQAYCGEDGMSETNLEGSLPPDAPTAQELYREVLDGKQQAVTVISIAPMTNLAHYLQQGGKLARVVTASGNYGVYRDPAAVNPRSSWNIRVDPEAAELVFTQLPAITAVGLDVSLRLHNSMVETLLSRANPHSHKTQFLQRAVEFNLKKGLEPYSLLVDALAVAQTIDPTLSRLTRGRVRVDTDSRILVGNTIFDSFGVLGNSIGHVQVAYDFDFERFLTMLVERVFK